MNTAATTPPKWKYREPIHFTAPGRTVHTIFLHCSASDNPAHDDRSVMKKWHLARGFSDIGYHFFINKNGNIQEGRSIESTPAAQQGHNTGSIAISCHGLKIENFTREQLESVKALCEAIVGGYDKKIRIRGHCEVSSKSCPVFDYKTLLNLDESGYMPTSSADQSTLDTIFETISDTVSSTFSEALSRINKPALAPGANSIQLFDRGDKVLALQKVLNRIGYPCGKDAIFGQQTHQCVNALQQAKGLEADGIVGRKTIASMFSSPTVILKSGDNNTDVAVLQLLLILHGKELASDGIFGAGTKKALESLQASLETRADGIFGPKTLALMN